MSELYRGLIIDVDLDPTKGSETEVESEILEQINQALKVVFDLI